MHSSSEKQTWRASALVTLYIARLAVLSIIIEELFRFFDKFVCLRVYASDVLERVRGLDSLVEDIVGMKD